MRIYVDHNGEFHATPRVGLLLNGDNCVEVVCETFATTNIAATVVANLKLLTAKSLVALAAAEWADRAAAPESITWGWVSRERWLQAAIEYLNQYGRGYAKQFFLERRKAAGELLSTRGGN